MRVEIWSDIACPWCYVGKARFDKALAAFPHRDRIEVVHRSFELDPARPITGLDEVRPRLDRAEAWINTYVDAEARTVVRAEPDTEALA
ncbi:hypothetical protein ADL27_14995, partial [Streptomyces sp. NRRL F-6602]